MHWTPEETVNLKPMQTIGIPLLLGTIVTGCVSGTPSKTNPFPNISDRPPTTILPDTNPYQVSPPNSDTSPTLVITTTTAAPVGTTWPPEPVPEPKAEVLLKTPVVEAFQELFDRSHPFLPIERFCITPPQREGEPQETDRGITDEMLTIVLMRAEFDELEKIGMSIPHVESPQILEAFAYLVNNECSGIHGRQVDLRVVNTPSLGGAGIDLDTLQTAACLEATEMMPAVIVLDLAGLGNAAASCVAVEHDTALLTTASYPSYLIDDAAGTLLTLSPTAEALMHAAVDAAEEHGLLDGRSIAVVVGDSVGQIESVTEGLIRPLRWLGYEPVLHLLGCEGSATCRVGRETAVSRMITAGTDIVFPVLNLSSLPSLIGEMVKQGMPKPAIIQTGFNNQSDDLAAHNVVTFAGPSAGAYYDDTLIVAAKPTGAAWLPDSELPAFDAMCNAEYTRASGRPVGSTYHPTTELFRTVVEACALMRMVARSVYDAGPDPRRRDVVYALAHLGPIDLPGMLPATSGHQKFALPDGVLELKYNYPCRFSSTGSTEMESGCIVPVGGYRTVY